MILRVDPVWVKEFGSEGQLTLAAFTLDGKVYWIFDDDNINDQECAGVCFGIHEPCGNIFIAAWARWFIWR